MSTLMHTYMARIPALSAIDMALWGLARRLVMINQLDAPSREKVLRELYDPSELGLEVTRICVGSSDYAATMYSYDEGEPDPDVRRFSIDHDKAYILPQLRTARKVQLRLGNLMTELSLPAIRTPAGARARYGATAVRK